MSLTSTRQGEPLAAPVTIPTGGVSADDLDNVLVVEGAFGTTGLYPLAEHPQDGLAVRHCNMYFVRLSASETTRARNPVVTDKTSYMLRYRGETYLNEAQCGVCLNQACPANRNPGASVGDRPAGTLILSLE